MSKACEQLDDAGIGDELAVASCGLFDVIPVELMALITAHITYGDAVALRSTCRAGREAILPPNGIALSKPFSETRSSYQDTQGYYFYKVFMPEADYNSSAGGGGGAGAADHRGLPIVAGVLPARVAAMRLSIRWNDQGWGNQKGAIEMKLTRGGDPIAASRVFGIAPHKSTEETVDITAADHVVLAAARPGDCIVFGANVGAGGGHHLTIDAFRCGMIWTTAA